MHEIINAPPMLSGDPTSQIGQIWNYLYGLSEVLNRNLQNIGGNDLTDKEREALRGIIPETAQTDYQSLKDILIQTAESVGKTLKEIRQYGLGEDVTAGKFDRYVNQTRVRIPADPSGNMITQQMDDFLSKLKQDDIGIRSYVYAGVLRTEDNQNVYGVAIGKNVVTFGTDGTETFHPENAEMEVLADGIHGDLTGDVTGDLTGDVTGNVTGDVTGDVTGNLTGDVTGDVTGNLTGDVTGDVTGNLTGDVTGNVTGDVTGNLTGDVTGDVTGNLTGDVTGNVTGDVTGNLTGDVTGNVIGDVTGDVTGDLTGDVTGNVTGDLTGNVTGDVIGNVTGDVTGDVTGNLSGKVLNAATTETDFDDITDAGKYWIDVSTMTHGPSDLLSGEYLLDVTEGTNRIQQQISAGSALYIRQSTSGTFGSWYKFTGTAV